MYSPFVIVVYESISCAHRKMKTKKNYICCVLALGLKRGLSGHSGLQVTSALYNTALPLKFIYE